MLCLKDDSGFVLVTSMLIMVVLTLIGMAALSSTTIELQIAGNDRVAKRNLYSAEAAAYEAAARLEAETRASELVAARSSKPWLQTPVSGQDPVLNIASILQNPNNPNDFNATGVLGASGPTVRLAALDNGIVRGARGSSLRMTASAVHSYQLVGYAQQSASWTLVEIGYKKRF